MIKGKKKKSIKIKTAIIVAACIVALSAITAGAVDAFSLITPQRALNGNSADNIANGGMAVMDEESGTVFYSNNGIYAKPKDKDAYELTDSRAQSLALKNGVIYFCNMSKNNRCYSINTDGTGLRALNEDISVEYINIDGESIYFACVKEIDKRGIYKMDLDGKNLKKISDVYAGSLILYKDYMYFINKEDSNRLYRMDKSGDDVLMITDDYTYCPVISRLDNRIYYSDGDAVYSCNLDGRFSKIIADMGARSIAISPDGTVVFGRSDYVNKSDDLGIYKVIDGEPVKIRDDEVMWIALCQDDLYFKSMTKSMEVMRCDLNGENGVYAAGNEGSSMLS